MNGDSKVLINSNNLIYTHKDKPPSNHNIGFSLKLVHTYNLHFTTHPMIPMFCGIVKKIELHEQFLVCYVFYHGVTMTWTIFFF